MSETSTAELWERLRRPFEPVAGIEALTGLHPNAARQLVATHLAGSAEADLLLDQMHEIVRSLAIATTSHPVRTSGEIRGPILWSETMAARTASPGAGGVLICASPVKAYDTPENGVLAYALARVRDAGQAVELHPIDASDEPLSRKARHNGTRAARALEHRTLAGIARTKPDGRAMRKARAGSRARHYRPAVALLDRAAEPVTADVVVAHTDHHTVRQHGLLLAILDRLGDVATPLRVEDSRLVAGPVRYVPRHRAKGDGLYGILIGQLLLDVADRDGDATQAELELLARAHGHPALVVQSPTDLERAIRLAGL